MSRNCPKNSRVRSENPGNPPGVSAYSLDIDALSTEDLQTLCMSSARIEEVPLNNLEITGYSESVGEADSSAALEGMFDDLPDLQSISDDASDATDADDVGNDLDGDNMFFIASQHAQHPGVTHPPRERSERSSLGNLYEERAMYLLDKYGPYLSSKAHDGDAFYVFGYDDDRVAVEYREHIPTETGLLFLARDALQDYSFDVVHWFRESFAAVMGATADEVVDMGSEPMLRAPLC
ncbi:hypothetical protein NUW54_g11840 [Trametes sanguinea]|uniref:Uncharacterized protein n=1 Tax=Trametes sanguinea TaxID=158606 RepID=A0ACC1N6A4_9APHY|nr:hypothetical protein NUW54_g11840 [Trametes sanguinea]